ncbi:MAG: hypothetical protein JKY96_07915 [Phycisphaerales bacterium]|nr:hypothetical protein [Phycisphaerales bacterium]
MLLINAAELIGAVLDEGVESDWSEEIDLRAMPRSWVMPMVGGGAIVLIAFLLVYMGLAGVRNGALGIGLGGVVVTLGLTGFWVGMFVAGIRPFGMSSAMATREAIETFSIAGHFHYDLHRDSVYIHVFRAGGVSMRGNSIMMVGSSMKNYSVIALSDEVLHEFVACYRGTFGADAVVAVGPRGEG